MKKKLPALFCALALLAGLLTLTLTAQAAPAAVYILAVNDKFADLPTLPEAVNGVIYIPYTTFDKDATGEDLGVYYGIKQDRGTILNLYSLNGILTFSVNQGICTDGDGNTMNFRAVIRNGIPYVPANAVCSFFGLQYSFLPTADRGTLIRICSATANLSNTVFLSAGSGGMLTRYNNILQSMDTQVTTPLPTPTPVPTPTPTGGNKADVTVYLSVDASEAQSDLTALFPSHIRALFLFTPESLIRQSALVRKAVAAGHSVGLLIDAATADEALAQLAEGNQLLSHIARIHTRIVSAPKELAAPLGQEGWLCWQPNITGATANRLLTQLDSRRTATRLALPGDEALITQVIRQLRTDGYTLRQPVETEI